MYILHILLLIVTIKFLINLFRLLETLYLHKIFSKRPANIDQYCPPVTSVFNSAGTQRTILVTFKSNGIKQAAYDYISNALSNKDSYYELERLFQKTIGVYKYRLLQALNPFFWLFLPKHVFEYFSIQPAKIIQLLINLIYWTVGFIGNYLMEMYFDSRFQDLFQNIIDVLP